MSPELRDRRIHPIDDLLQAQIAAAISDAIMEERKECYLIAKNRHESCADLMEGADSPEFDAHEAAASTALQIAAAIRARSKQ